MTVKELKKGDYFTIKEIENPHGSQVFIRGEYDRASGKYVCGKFDDISASRLLDGKKQVYIDFTF
jgi:hypothetical protein